MWVPVFGFRDFHVEPSGFLSLHGSPSISSSVDLDSANVYMAREYATYRLATNNLAFPTAETLFMMLSR